MKNRYIFILLSILLPLAAIGHTGSIRGSIKDGSTQVPVEGAGVFIKDLQASAATDAFGTFFLKGLKDGRYAITISHIGYETITESIKVEDGVTTEFIKDLRPAGVSLSGVTVNAKKDLAHSTISGLDLKLRPVNTAQDMLRLVPGLFISQHQGGGKAEQMFLRGFDVDHGTDVNVSVDGMPVNMVSHAHGQGYADLHFLMPELVDKMKFGKGPYQIDKGNLATAGWVDFKTKDRLDSSFVKMEGGMYGYFRTVAALSLLDKKDDDKSQDAYIAGEYAYNKGYFDAPQDFNRINFTGKYTARLAKNKMFSIMATAFRSNWDASGQIPERAVAEGLLSRFGHLDKESGTTSRYNLNLQFSQAIGNNSFFKSNLYAAYYDFELYSNFTFYLKDSINGDQIKQKEKRALAGYNAAYSTNYTLAGMRTKTEIGAGIRYDNTMGSELSHTLNRKTVLNTIVLGDIYETNAYGYLNQTFNLTPQLVLNAGTRFDYFIHSYNDRLATEAPLARTYNTHAFSPKAGLYYNFSDNARVYFNYGTGFHTNDTRVVVAQSAQTILPLAYSYDLGTVIKPFHKLLFSAALWRLDLQQEFVYVGDEGVVENAGPTTRMGVDLSARYEVLKWLYADVDINYTHGRSVNETEGRNYIPLAPAITSIGGLTAKLSNGISGSLRYRSMGNRPANVDNSVIAKGYAIFDATISYSRKQYELGIQIQNLFDNAWNEAQFDTETRLRNEPRPVSEICFTPGTPFFLKFTATYRL